MSFTKEYKDFFVNSEAGNACVAEIKRLIDVNHKKAEDDPEKARDYMQRAKGNREVLDHIQNVMIEVKKGKSM